MLLSQRDTNSTVRFWIFSLDYSYQTTEVQITTLFNLHGAADGMANHLVRFGINIHVTLSS